jgi:probable F420-dependent oxidoreductase
MQFGFNLPLSGPILAPDDIARIAVEGEALGFDYLTLTDHVVLPAAQEAGYPYSESGAFLSAAPTRRHEQLVTAAFVAAKTRRIRLVTAILVVPHRPAVLAAKMLATIDVLSGGRLTVGIGTGWLQSEFDAVVTTPFAERGAVTDAYLEAFRELWTAATPRLAGRYVKFDGLVFEPKPVQKPHPPLWIGGESPPSLRRAARLGDAWYPIGSNQRHPLDTLPRYRAGVERLRRLAAEAGRDPARIGLGYRVKRWGPAVPSPATDGERRLFAGTIDQVIGDLHALRDLGVTAVDFEVEQGTADATIDTMRRLREEVLSRV